MTCSIRLIYPYWWVLALLPSACALAPPQAGAPHTYTLDLPRPGVWARPAGDRVLAVMPVHAAPPYQGDAMVYRRRPHELQAFAHHRWQAPPARLLEPLLVAALAADGAYRAVLRGDPLGVADRRLDLELSAFYQDFTRLPSRVRVGLRARLMDMRRRRLLGTVSLTEEAEAPSDDPYGGVIAYHRALQRLIPRLGAFLRGREGIGGEAR